MHLRLLHKPKAPYKGHLFPCGVADMVAYVAGLLFSAERDRVLLIEKRRPAWQAGRLNGVGGKIEPGETPLEAMEREFDEEASISGLTWTPVTDLRGNGFTVHFFSAFDGLIDSARARTDEPLHIHPVRSLQDLPILENLRTIIPIALDRSGIRKPVELVDIS